MRNNRYMINGIVFYINADEALTPMADVLAQAMKNIPVERICDDYKFEIGFSVYICKQTDNGFTLVAPDYLNHPLLNTTEDLTVPLGEFSIEVYNFNVEEYHTYFVGNACIFVHNSECGGSYGSLKKIKREKCMKTKKFITCLQRKAASYQLMMDRQ